MSTREFATNIPSRIDRLPWSSWHWRIVVGLGTVWILDGLEVTVVGSLGERLTHPRSGLHLSPTQVGGAAAAYVAGAAMGALIFGYLTDQWGRKRMFMITLGLYVLSTIATAFSIGPLSFLVCRFFTGTAIGGEYSAINSAIDELIPAKVRGWVDLAINGSFWLGAIAGAGVSLLLLNPHWFALDIGWRIAFGLGALLGGAILFVRRHVPESPRWLVLHDAEAQAEALVTNIEERISQSQGPLPNTTSFILLRPTSGSLRATAKTLIRTYPKRTVLCLSLFVGQAFLYNSIFFTQALVLAKFFNVSDAQVSLCIIPIAIGNFLGPVALGPLFDRFGRRLSITSTFIVSGALLVTTGILLQHGVLTATSLTACWTTVFFFASAAASSAYLTVSEIFPVEIRALSIALFYAVGTSMGGVVGPLLFGSAIQAGTLVAIARGYYLGAALMVLAGLAEAIFGVEAARQSLEHVAPPLSLVQAPERKDT